MKKIAVTVLFLCVAGISGVRAQVTGMNADNFKNNASAANAVAATPEKPWKLGGNGSATFSQVALSNWAAGGEGAVAYNLMFNYNANYKKDKHLWTNRLELAYGMNYSKSKGSQKINDKIYLASMYGYGLGHNWFLSALLNFNTQFANGFDYGTTPKHKISRFMAPGYLSAGIGVTWNPKKWFNATFAPAMWRGTFVLDEDLFYDNTPERNPLVSAFGVPFGENMLNEFGANVRLEVNYDIAKNVNLYSRLDLYSNYLKDPQNVDVRWDIVLNSNITKWLSANLTLNMIWDEDIKFPKADGTMGGTKFQVKEVLGIGLQATF